MMKTSYLRTLALGCALVTGFVIAPAATASPISASAYIDVSCNPTTFGGQITLVQGDETMLWYDAMSGTGTAAANYHDHYSQAERISWIEYVPEANEQVMMNGTRTTVRQRAQIAYLLNRHGISGSSPSPTTFATNYAIRSIMDAPRYACHGPATTSAAAQMVAETTMLTGDETGEAEILPVITSYDRDAHSFTLTDVDVRDRGSDFSYGSAQTGHGLQVELNVNDASFDPQTPANSRSVVVVANNMINVERSFYAARPGPVTLTLHTKIPSPRLHLLRANHMSDQIYPGNTNMVSKTITLQVPKDELTVTKTIGATSLALNVTGYRPWLTGSNTLRAVALPSPSSGLPPVERTWSTSSTAPVTMTGLTPNTTYELTVADLDGYVIGHESTFTTGPVAPTNPRTTAGPTNLALSWQPTPGATGYEVTVGSSSRTVAGTTTQITGLQPATTYPVSVQALNLPARGGVVTVEARTTLPEPGKVAVIRKGSHSTVVSWTNVPGATHYQLTIDGHHGEWRSATATAVLTGLTQGRTYTGTLTALADGETPSSSRFTLTTIPSVANGIKVTTTTPTSLGLSWRSGSPGTCYTVKVVGNHGRTITTRDSAVTITGLKANKSYRISIQAANAEGTSGWSPALTVRTAKKTKAKITVRRNTRKTRIKVTRAPSARVKVQRKKAGVWQTIRRKRAVRNKLQLSVTIAKSARLRVVVAATPSTRQTKRVVR